MKGTILENAGRAEIRQAPFPHMVIDNALDPVLFDALQASRPTMMDQQAGASRKGNVRMPISARMFRDLEFYPSCWRAFTARHVQADIYFAIRTLFGNSWPENQPQLLPADARFGLMEADDFDHYDVLCDARLELISPGKVYGSHRRAHLDAPNRLFSALLYFRDAVDDTKGGGLDLFAWKNGPTDNASTTFEIDENAVECRVNVPYRANQLVIFPNSIHALHGSEPRDAGPHERAYVFITAEMRDDWM